MKTNVILWIMVLCLVLLVLSPSAFGTTPLDESPVSLHILEDGSVDPPNASVERVGDIYTLTGDVAHSIIVDRDNVTIDGAGYALLGNLGDYPGSVRLNHRVGVTVRNLVVKDTIYAFDLSLASDNSLVGNTIINSGTGVNFWISWRNNVSGNVIVNASYGFYFFGAPTASSQYNVITGNNVIDSQIGLSLSEPNNTFSDNTITSSHVGVSLSGSQNLFQNNVINNTGISLMVSSFDNDIDESNLVNGKPIIYWNGRRDVTVPSDAGYVLLYNCENVTAQNLQLSGVNIASTTNCLIAGNTVSGGACGIQMHESYNNTVTGNSVMANRFGLDVTNCEDNEIVGNDFSNNSYYGILLTNSNYNTLERNNVAYNGFGETKNYSIFIFEQYSGDIFGVKLLHSSNNRFIENNVVCNNAWGIRVLGYQHDNIIYHNNFIDNKVRDNRLQVSMMAPVNPSIWDNGTSGNYWSEYQTRYQNASEVGDTGIGDTPFFINENNIDHYPLMNPLDLKVIPEFQSSTQMLLVLTILTVALMLYRLKNRKSETNDRHRTAH